MHIYTGQGDDGRTLLLTGERVWKDDPRVRFGGDLDELSACLGVVAAHAPHSRPEFAVQLREVQGELFAVGAVAHLMGRLEPHPEVRPVGRRESSRLERWIDAIEAELTPLEGFIAPGGAAPAAFAHLARTVCRRAERGLVALIRDADEAGRPALTDALAYLNRLADFLFVFARFCNRLANVEEIRLTTAERNER
jgi:cob(I)alamin adenosyltransferase